MVAHARALTARTAAPAVVALGLVVSVGCAPRPLYHWGHYEELVYEMYTAPGKAEPAVQVDKLTRDVAEAQTEGLRVPPGVHLHLGHMYFLEGNAAAARAELEIEKLLFPESAVFVDRLLKQMGGQ